MGSILVAGGYGAFGARIVERLAREPDLSIIVAGRSDTKAAAEVARQKAKAKAQLSPAALDATTAAAAELKALSASVVVNASGPFQAQKHSLARAAIAAGAHYVDIADARQFVMGIPALDDEARRAGVLVVSGASSVPGLSSAVVRHHAHAFREIREIDIGISPGNSFDPGEAATASVLGGLGKPIATTRDGKPVLVHGWQGLSRHAFPGLGPRWMGYVDVPDLDLFPQLIPALRTLRFRAGLEVGLAHLGLYGLSWLVRASLIRRPERLAGPMLAMKRRLAFLGSDRGGMFVDMRGIGLNGAPRQVRWSLIAGSGHGPYVPALGSVVLTRRLARGEEARRGAAPCFGHFTLDEFLAGAEGLDIRTSETVN